MNVNEYSIDKYSFGIIERTLSGYKSVLISVVSTN